MFRKNDWEEVCQNVNNRDLQVAGLWVLLFFFPSKIYQASSQMANSPQGQSPIHSDLCHSSLEKPLSRVLRTSVKCLS